MRAFTVIDAEQRSDEWRQARCGRLTASVVAALYAKGKGKEEAVGRRDLRLRLALERLTGVPQEDDYSNAHMRRGVELEPDAVAAYEARMGRILQPSGFLAHNELLIGCSLDGHLDDFGGIVELKVPKSAIHLGYLREGVLPTEYIPQVTHSLLITGADYCDFMSFDPRFPEALQTFLVRVWAKDLDLKAHELLVRLFLTEVEKETEAIEQLAAVAA